MTEHKLSRNSVFAIVGGLLLLFSPLVNGQNRPLPAAITRDELTVYAAALDSMPGLGKGTRVLIADSTSTFACDRTICNGFSMGSCNGLRGADESPAERLAIVKRDLPGLSADTMSSFLERNQKCVALHDQISTDADYRYLNDPNIPKDWKYEYIAYFSRVGFNAEHTQALINVGLFSATDAKLSRGRYALLQLVDGKWELRGTSAVWELAQ